jgi:glucose-6-phosphate 1-dehydrogenase
LILQEEEAERVLYLAIPFDIYNNFFQRLFARKAVENYQIKLIIYNSKKEVIVQWIN